MNKPLYHSYRAVFTGPGDRARLLALGDVDQREREAVRAAEERRANADATRVVHLSEVSA